MWWGKMAEGVMIAVLVSVLMLIIRMVLGSTAFDRILAVNCAGTLIVALVALAGFIFKTEYFLDIAITYALINFIATIALLRYFQFKSDQEV